MEGATGGHWPPAAAARLRRNQHAWLFRTAQQAQQAQRGHMQAGTKHHPRTAPAAATAQQPQRGAQRSQQSQATTAATAQRTIGIFEEEGGQVHAVAAPAQGVGRSGRGISSRRQGGALACAASACAPSCERPCLWLPLSHRPGCTRSTPLLPALAAQMVRQLAQTACHKCAVASPQPAGGRRTTPRCAVAAVLLGPHALTHAFRALTWRCRSGCCTAGCT